MWTISSGDAAGKRDPEREMGLENHLDSAKDFQSSQHIGKRPEKGEAIRLVIEKAASRASVCYS